MLRAFKRGKGENLRIDKGRFCTIVQKGSDSLFYIQTTQNMKDIIFLDNFFIAKKLLVGCEKIIQLNKPCNDIPHVQKSKNEFLLNQAQGKAAILHNGVMTPLGL